ncbi:MAG TPA: phosphatase PAP2 family protein [Candidatus Acidoferrales bacterium]|nr:phosphatase PAP2 family protein [Candidatus Acidoferrales bacterium]
MSESSEPFWGWPGWKHLRFAWLISLMGLLWFILVYGGADILTAHRSFRVRVYLDVELNIPFIPEAAIVYMSIYPLFIAAPFILRKRLEFFALAMTLNMAILVAGICFLLFPAQVAFPPPKGFGAFPGLFHFADRLSLTYNLVPSLHVALSTICIAVFAARTGATWKILLWTWAVAIAVSTLLIHKHHLLDVATGFLLAWILLKFFYHGLLDKLKNHYSFAHEPPAARP